MPEQKYMPYSVKDYTGMRIKRIIKDIMGGSVGSRSDIVKQYKKSKKNGRKI